MDITIMELKELKQTLLEGVTDNIFDDGSDNDDALQNAAYTREVNLIEEVGEKLSKLESVEGDRINGKKSLWRDCWEYKSAHLPEDEYNHHMKFIDSLIARYELSERHS